MSSSISSSEWRPFARSFGLAAAAVLGVLYGFVALVDPWDALPLSPPLPRVPISTNARFSFPALARSRQFDAVILGTSTARLLRPADLDGPFGAHFANLAMNSATAWEQVQLLHVFLRAHPHPRAVVLDLDASWCGPTADRLTPRPFPDWMYQPNRWPAYLHMLTPFAVQEAANQLAVMLHLKRPRYGLDGYTRFVPPDSAYDPARVDAAFARWEPVDASPAQPSDPMPLPALDLLRPALAAIPPGTRTILFFPPINIEQHGAPGSRVAARWAACKSAAARIAAGHGATVLDFLHPSPLTRERSNFWDPLHVRERVAARVATLLAKPEPPEVQVVTPR